MVAFAMHLLRTVPELRHVAIHPDGEHGKRFDFRDWLERHGFALTAPMGSTTYGGNLFITRGADCAREPEIWTRRCRRRHRRPELCRGMQGRGHQHAARRTAVPASPGLVRNNRLVTSVAGRGWTAAVCRRPTHKRDRSPGSADGTAREDRRNRNCSRRWPGRHPRNYADPTSEHLKKAVTGRLVAAKQLRCSY